MRGLIKFGIGCWTRKIELSKSMELTKGKISLEQEQNSNSSLPGRQEAGVTLRAAVSAVHVEREPCNRQFWIYLGAFSTELPWAKTSEKPRNWQENLGSWGHGFMSEVASVCSWCRTGSVIRCRVVGDSLDLDVVFKTEGFFLAIRMHFFMEKCC